MWCVCGVVCVVWGVVWLGVWVCGVCGVGCSVAWCVGV